MSSFLAKKQFKCCDYLSNGIEKVNNKTKQEQKIIHIVWDQIFTQGAFSLSKLPFFERYTGGHVIVDAWFLQKCF